MIPQPPIDKSTWGDGPWQTEPDRVEFEHAGLPCLITRNRHHGHLCGYVAVPPGHPLHGKSDDDVRLAAHGGVNYADFCVDHICHVPKPGESDNVWWFGFDCGHAWDIQPGWDADLIKRGLKPIRIPIGDMAYRDLPYVQENVKRLAEQLAAAAMRKPLKPAASLPKSEAWNTGSGAESK